MKATKVFRWMGVVLITMGSVAIIPPLINKLSAKLSRAYGSAKKIDFDNLGPVVEKIQK